MANPTAGDIHVASQTIDNFLTSVPPDLIGAEAVANTQTNPTLRGMEYEKIKAYIRTQLHGQPGVTYNRLLGYRTDAIATPDTIEMARVYNRLRIKLS
jgi:hypothetical protein